MRYSTKVVLQMTDDPYVYTLVEKDTHEFYGQPDLACNPLQMLGVPSGPSSSEQSLAAQESDLSRSLKADFTQRYGEQSQTMKDLNGVLTQIRTGQTGPGFGAAEEAGYRTDIINQAAAATRNAEQAAANVAAGQQFGTGGSERVSGIRQQIGAGIAAASETEKSALLRRNEEQNAAQGRINAAQTAGGLERLATLQNPEQYANLASSTGQTAFGQAGTIRKLQDAHAAGIGNLIKAGVEDVVMPGISGAMSAGGGFADTIKGFLGGATGMDFLGGGTVTGGIPENISGDTTGLNIINSAINPRG